MTKAEGNNMMNCAIHRVVTKVEEIEKNESPFSNSQYSKKKITEKKHPSKLLNNFVFLLHFLRTRARFENSV